MNGKVRTPQFFHHKMICKSFNVRFFWKQISQVMLKKFTGN